MLGAMVLFGKEGELKMVLSDMASSFAADGQEKEVLLGMDFTKFRPWLIIMESTEPGTDIPSHQKWEYILLEKYLMSAAKHNIIETNSQSLNDLV